MTAADAPVAAATAGLRDALRAWWPAVRRERDGLPWRAVRDPWLTLVAEFMLAQTQVARVAERFPGLAAAFPTASACAAVPVGDVVSRWVGLGYNRRAVALHRCATAIVEHHDGVVPRRLEDLLALPGVGPYTARAVRAFAFGDRAGVVDTNTGRVLVRAVAGERISPAGLQRLADALVPERGAREWNLLLMDFGSLVCRSVPACERCPAAAVCAWRTSAPSPDPAPTRRGAAPFAGSDREGRGRLVRAACSAPVAPDDLVAVTGWDVGRARRVADRLVVDGVLARDASGSYQLA